MTHQEFLKKWLPEMPQRKQEKFLQDFAAMVKPPDNNIWVESIISHRDTRPVVSVRIGEYSFQVDPDTARKIGRDFYEVAGGAEMDAVMFQYLTGEVQLEAEKAYAAIAHLRKWRDDRQRLNAEQASGPKQ